MRAGRTCGCGWDDFFSEQEGDFGVEGVGFVRGVSGVSLVSGASPVAKRMVSELSKSGYDRRKTESPGLPGRLARLHTFFGRKSETCLCNCGAQDEDNDPDEAGRESHDFLSTQGGVIVNVG